MKYLLFSLLRSSVEAKRGVKLRRFRPAIVVAMYRLLFTLKFPRDRDLREKKEYDIRAYVDRYEITIYIKGLVIDIYYNFASKIQ